jgi:type IV pilus modification protein PilV
MDMRNTHRKPAARGFTLLEALVALLVVAFGMLGIVKMQSVISGSADVAKQRSEAVRLGQEKMECLRSFSQIASAAATTANCNGTLNVLSWNGLGSATDPANPLTSSYSNTSYSRNWSLTGAPSDPLRALTVTVQWTDRAEQAQSVTLTSVIAKADPLKEGMLGFPLPANSNLKRPKDRNLNIPVPATQLGDGKSVYQIGSALAVVFSNESGSVIQKCNTVVTVSNYESGTAGCTSYDAYIVAGYVTAESAAALAVPTGINTASLTGWDTGGAISCTYSTAVDQSTGATLSDSKYYLCVIPVVAGSAWSGTIRLAGLTSSTAGNNSSRWLACRFQYANNANLSDNARNVQPYATVRESLDNQNYYVVAGSSCPSVTTIVGNGPSQQSVTVPTVLHQDCRTGTTTTANCPTPFTTP